MYQFLKSVVNFCIVLFIKCFTKNRVSFSGNIHPKTFVYCIRNNVRNVRFGKAYIGGESVFVDNGVIFHDRPILFGKVTIGRHTSISGPATRICSRINQVTIGNFCSIASNVIIQEFYHNTKLATTYNILSNIFKKSDTSIQVVSKGSVIIEDDVWIGSNVSILSGITIGRGSVIGAGSVVTKDIPPYSIAAGNPCKVIKERFPSSVIKDLEDSKWWLWDDELLKENASFFMVERVQNDK